MLRSLLGFLLVLGVSSAVHAQTFQQVDESEGVAIVSAIRDAIRPAGLYPCKVFGETEPEKQVSGRGHEIVRNFDGPLNVLRSTQGQPVLRFERPPTSAQRMAYLVTTDASETKLVTIEMQNLEIRRTNRGTLTRPRFEDSWVLVSGWTCKMN